MRKVLIVLLIMLGFCGVAKAKEFKLLKEDVELNYSDFTGLMTANDEALNCEIKKTDLFCSDKKGMPYTGSVYSIYPNPALRLKKDRKLYKDLIGNSDIPVQIKTKANLLEGRLDGLLEIFYKNGKPKVKVYYKNHKLNGVRKTYYKNGQLEKKGKYKNGKQEGLWRVYDISGNVAGEVTFKDGEPYY